MKKYNITNMVEKIEQIRGIEPKENTDENFVGDYIMADNEEEAIELAIDFLSEQIVQNGYKCETENNEIKVFDEDNNIIENYYNFKAQEI